VDAEATRVERRRRHSPGAAERLEKCRQVGLPSNTGRSQRPVAAQWRNTVPFGVVSSSRYLSLRLRSDERFPCKMNVIAKSTGISPFLRATATAVSNGSTSVASTGKVQKPKFVTFPPVQRILGQTMYQDLLTGPIRISSGVSGASIMR